MTATNAIESSQKKKLLQGCGGFLPAENQAFPSGRRIEV
jgi:hypothetical protein